MKSFVSSELSRTVLTSLNVTQGKQVAGIGGRVAIFDFLHVPGKELMVGQLPNRRQLPSSLILRLLFPLSFTVQNSSKGIWYLLQSSLLRIPALSASIYSFVSNQSGIGKGPFERSISLAAIMRFSAVLNGLVFSAFATATTGMSLCRFCTLILNS